MVIDLALSTAGEKLNKNNIQTPRLDAEVLLAHILGKAREYVVAHPEQRLSKKQIASYELLVARRASDEPLAYLVGHKEFYGLDFLVDKYVLIPRPETELLIDKSLALLRSMLRNKLRNKMITIIDVGTGSGCIVISLAAKLKDQLPKSKIVFLATDSSKKALNVAQKNAKNHGVGKDIKFLRGNLLTPFFHKSVFINHKSEILLLVNLPYLSKNIFSTSSNSVKKFEPKSALLSGTDGLNHYRRFLNQLKLLVTNYQLQATVLCEISPEQKNSFRSEVISRFPEAIILFSKDLCGKWRIARCLLK